jgi:hypothetical protein
VDTNGVMGRIQMNIGLPTLLNGLHTIHDIEFLSNFRKLRSLTISRAP